MTPPIIDIQYVQSSGLASLEVIVLQLIETGNFPEALKKQWFKALKPKFSDKAWEAGHE